MELFTQFLISTWAMTVEMASWLLIGFGLAGFLSQLLPTSLIQKHLAQSGLGSILKAVVIGIPLPLCSCGVIPVAESLRKAGASKGAVASFTAATPQTGVDSIAATYSLIGLPFTLGRLAANLISGFAAGILINTFASNESDIKQDENTPRSCCSQETQCCSNTPLPKKETAANRIQAALKEAFFTLPADLGVYLVIGIFIGAAMTTFIPQGLFSNYLTHPMLSYLVVTFIAIPTYVCATGSIPIAVGLIAGGISPGAAIVFLVAGPATNVATISTLLKIIGKSATIIYLASLLIGAWLVGFAFDQFSIDLVTSHIHQHEETSFVATLSAIVFVGIIVNAVVRKKLLRK